MTQPKAQDPVQAMNVERLQKVLSLERSLGCTNRAVIGGLDAFVKPWALEAHRAVAHPMVRSGLARLGLMEPRYEAMTTEERAAWIDRVLAWTEGLGGGGGGADLTPLPPSLRGKGEGTEGGSETRPYRRTQTGDALRQAPSMDSGRRQGERNTAAPHSQPAPRRGPPLLGPGQGLDTPIELVRGWDRWDQEALGKLQKLGVGTVRDILYYFPRRHIDFSSTQPIASLQVGKEHTALGTVWEAEEVRVGLGGKRRAAQAIIGDDSGNIRAIWFGQPYIARWLKPGQRVALAGRVTLFKGRKVFENPEYETVGAKEQVHTGRLVPVYPLTAGLTSRRMRAIVKRTVDGAGHLIGEFVEAEQRRRLGLLELPAAIRQAHFPDNEAEGEQARRRLAFDELYLLQLGVLGRKQVWKESLPGHPLRADPRLVEAYVQALPFGLTGAQQRVMHEVIEDLGKQTPMSRLVQGEVGSGKTVVALAAALVAVGNGQQAAFMAPTEILAEQHFRTVARLLGGTPAAGQQAAFSGMEAEGQPERLLAFHLPGHPRPITVGLLMGAMTGKRKQEVQELAAHGELDILIGTHALFQKDVEFASLALAIVDEQHRFGVMQRSELRQKGYNPHLLVMTATPIPRSLSLTLYGDLDLSAIDEMPPGRQEIKTRWLEASEREKAYRFVRKEVESGRQAFIIYPLIEESEALDVGAATAEHERLSREVFPDLKLGLLHGRLKAAEKDRVMRAFHAGELHILVSTPVVEVGIDVPNATVMVIESAERFGLAQLHQFRGRVGRGEHPGYCILISEAPTLEAGERLRVLESVHDGFTLAEEDLKLRGPGEFFGTRQSGLPDLRMARLSDTALLDVAREEASRVFAQDPGLSKPEHQALAKEVARTWAHRTAAVGEG